jgi:hypothetical protein
MEKTLLQTVLERSPGPWLCHSCRQEVVEPQHADEGDGESVTTLGRDRIYCDRCGGCTPGSPAHLFCDTCYGDLLTKINQLGDETLIETTKDLFGFN